MPEWYVLIRAASYLHVPPWELLQHPASRVWTALALRTQEIDNRGAELRRKFESRKQAGAAFARRP